MKETSPDLPSIVDRIRSWLQSKAHGTSPLSASSTQSSTLPLDNLRSSFTGNVSDHGTAQPPSLAANQDDPSAGQPSRSEGDVAVVDNTSADSPPPAPPPQGGWSGSVISPEEHPPPNIAIRFYETAKTIIFSTWLNILLVFVPVGIIVKFVPDINPTIIFVMNSIAIVPLAGLLSHATESVAKRMGDTIGALMNVTFGNAVEIIIFMYVYLNGDQDKKEREALLKALSYQSRPISSSPLNPLYLACNLTFVTTSAHSYAYLTIHSIALAHDEIPIVQAALLGSILANLLLILGMCFLLGGLRFREQIYNSTVTQMSACLLSLSVMSLLLPTAFHASFNDTVKADDAVLQVSRGTSVILLLVYGMYLLFQLKSHAYLYESTPQHIIDEESVPGPVAAWMDSSDSDGDSSSSSDSDESRGSTTTAGRIRRVMRGGRKRRKFSASSRDTELPVPTRTPSYAASTSSPMFSDVFTEEPIMSPSAAASHRFGSIELGNEGDNDMVKSRENQSISFGERNDRKLKKERRHRKRRHSKTKGTERAPANDNSNEKQGNTIDQTQADRFNEPRRVDFAVPDSRPQTNESPQKNPFSLLGIRPAIPKTFSQNVFTQPSRSDAPNFPETPIIVGPIPHVRYGIRRTNSLPDRLNQTPARTQLRLPPCLPLAPSNPALLNPVTTNEENISRTTALVLLLISTGLVALCANFMVDSIDSVTNNTSLGATFVGLILLPIVGNAAEHVTAVTVAAKNKMDLAIGVAVGSSIQIALFITPFIVLLGWCMGKPMTLYFTLFETVSLFVSVFVVNFLVLDGRSNFLEGALLCAAYIIIAVAAFFYPGLQDQNSLGGGSKTARSILGI